MSKPVQPFGSLVAELILARWNMPATHANLDAIESACALPIAQLTQLCTSLPRWICADEREIGSRISEA